LISRGSFAIFVTRPISAVLMILAAAFLLTALVPILTSKREKIAADMGE
jgi:putative tricarboxylic transport membrane protein